MKRLVLLAMIAISTMTFAQKGKVSLAQASLDQGDVAAAKEQIDIALEHEKTVNWPKTYIVAAKVYTELEKAKTDSLGYEKAVDFYAKAIELDQKGDAKGKGIGRFEKEIKLALTFFKPDLVNEGVRGFNEEDYPAAVFAFENVIKIDELEMFKEDGATVDTMIVYNCALAAYNANDYDVALKYFDQSIDMKYGGGDAVLLVNEIYTQQKNLEGQEANLQKGFETYPEDTRILTTLIQFYIDNEKTDDALAYLNKAIEGDPQNALYYQAQGILYEKFDREQAIVSYKKALEIDPEFFSTLYYIGVIYFNMGVEEQNDANAKTTTKEFEAGMKKANAYWKEAIPYLERARAVKPEELAVLEALKGLYYRFEENDKYTEVSNKIKEVEAAQ